MRDSWNIAHHPFDPAAAGPPIPGDPGHGGLRTMKPTLGSPQRDHPSLSAGVSPYLTTLFRSRLNQSLRIRNELQTGRRELCRMVGGENIQLSFAAREGVSTDSTGHRGLVSEALFLPPDLASLQALVAWCFRHRIPMIPYGAGSGYNMGVVPLAPAVTVWPACLNAIDAPRPHPRGHGRATHVVSAGGGAAYSAIVGMAGRHGLAVRCVPNSPRASVGGIVATGSNGGRRIGEIVVGGQAVLADGTLARFAATPQERAFWAESPFPLVHKFHDAPKPGQLRRMIRDGDVLPASLFVGSEGTTGIITSVELELETPAAHGITAGIWLARIDHVPALVHEVRALGCRPAYFELLTQPAIDRFLRTDFPDLFDGAEQAYVIVTFEDDSEDKLKALLQRLQAAIPRTGRLTRAGPYPTMAPPPEAIRLMAPREVLPKKLVSKCKSDVEALVEALPRVIRHLAASHTADGVPVESILFGHLTARDSAILHWNIGGVDLAVEETAERAWRHLEHTLADVTRPEPDAPLQAVFTGEHGASGKPALFRDVLARGEMARLLLTKRALDPRRLLNPMKLFLPSRGSKAISARLLRRDAHDPSEPIHDIVARCTRCNACQNCPVIEAQIMLRTRRKPRHHGSVIVGKRGLLHALELLGSSRLDESHQAWLAHDASERMDACISCGRCDAACPAGISMDDIAALLPKAMPPRVIPLLHRVFLAPAPRSAALRGASAAQRALRPMVGLMRKGFTTRARAAYAAIPVMDWRRYKSPGLSAPGMHSDLSLVGDRTALVFDGEIAVRFKGCVGSVGHARASLQEDRFFTAAGGAFLDFVPDLCCGFPFLASGDRRASRQRRDRLWQGIYDASRAACQGLGAARVVVMSSCPTCQESLRQAHQENGAPPHVRVCDPAEYAVGRAAVGRRPAFRTVGLKIPCHATFEAIAAQKALLQTHGYETVCLPQCCGMAGTGRLEHPEVGLILAETLAATIREHGLDTVVSGCPSCRDGMRLQAAIDSAGFRVDDIYALISEAP